MSRTLPRRAFLQYSVAMNAIDPILMELEQEAATTRRVLERVPEEQLGWKPHEKSMTLGQLAMHTATTPGGIAAMLSGDTFQIPERFDNLPTAATRQEILEAHDASVAAARQFLGGLDAEKASAIFRIMAGTQQLMAVPRLGMIRTIMLNHWYHHRGQMTVYLRMLNVPVPVVYGRSADESGFGPAKQASA
jgi:uncharacterized damage-inducible protein DinB